MGIWGGKLISDLVLVIFYHTTIEQVNWEQFAIAISKSMNTANHSQEETSASNDSFSEATTFKENKFRLTKIAI